MPAVANPVPLGLFSNAATGLLLSFFNVHVRGVHNGNMVLGMSFATGGIVQLISGMMALKRNMALPATSFLMYGSFWLAYGFMNLSNLGISETYTAETKGQLNEALGLFLAMWTIVSFLLSIGALGTSIVLWSMYVCLTLMYMTAAIAALLEKEAFWHAAGWFGIAAAGFTFYEATSQLYTPDTTWFSLPSPLMPGATRSRSSPKLDNIAREAASTQI